MTTRQISEKQRSIKEGRSPIAKTVSQSMLYLGAFVIIFGLIYMMLNLPESDSIIFTWIPFMITGVALVVMSQLIKGSKKIKKEKNVHFQKHSNKS
jgi:uncharacterized membrane protein